MQTQSLTPSVIGTKIPPAICPTADQFGLLAGHTGLVTTEFSYGKDEEIYGEDEPAEYVYQVIQGSVRTYKLLSDGRRQISAFHLPGDVFGLESGSNHRLAAAADGTAQHSASRREIPTAARSGMAAGAHTMDKILPSPGLEPRARAARWRYDDLLCGDERRRAIHDGAAAAGP